MSDLCYKRKPQLGHYCKQGNEKLQYIPSFLLYGIDPSTKTDWSVNKLVGWQFYIVITTKGEIFFKIHQCKFVYGNVRSVLQKENLNWATLLQTSQCKTSVHTFIPFVWNRSIYKDRLNSKQTGLITVLYFVNAKAEIIVILKTLITCKQPSFHLHLKCIFKRPNFYLHFSCNSAIHLQEMLNATAISLNEEVI